ncbi:F0F1 ATP synthase subunit A [Candidatus Peribacteria bacterium]|nr:F0F1 ATP synthase subunit A [Candidatus Peribacteria bacterium]
MDGPNISLAPEIIFQIWGFSFTNAHLTFSLVAIFVVALLVLMASRFSVRPSKFQIVMEELYNFFKSKIDITGLDPLKKKILLSIVLTLFILIFISNIFSVAPILSSITLAI